MCVRHTAFIVRTHTHTYTTHTVLWQPPNWQATSLLKTFRNYHVASCYPSTNERWQGIFHTQNWDKTHTNTPHTDTHTHTIHWYNIIQVHEAYSVRLHNFISLFRYLFLSFIVNVGMFSNRDTVEGEPEAEYRMQDGDQVGVHWDTTVHAGHFSTHYQHHQSMLPL